MHGKRKEGERVGKRKWGKWRIVSVIFVVHIFVIHVGLYMGYSALITTGLAEHVILKCHDIADKYNASEYR